jgi:hypothetical protein
VLLFDCEVLRRSIHGLHEVPVSPYVQLDCSIIVSTWTTNTKAQACLVTELHNSKYSSTVLVKVLGAAMPCYGPCRTARALSDSTD